MRAHEIQTTQGSRENTEEDEGKESAEITALEHLSYINACARMELLNANSKLLNYQILKKNIIFKPNPSDVGNKSMDFTLTFRSDFNYKEKASKKKKSNNEQYHTDVEDGKVP